MLVKTGKNKIMKPQSTLKKITYSLLSILSLLFIFKTSPANEQGVWIKSYNLEASGQYKEAAALITPFLEGNGNTTEYALLRYGWLNYLLRNHNDAIRSYKKAISQNPKSIDAHLGITLPLLAQERWEDAARHARQVLKKSPWEFTAHQRLLLSEEGNRHWSILKKHASELAVRYPSSAIPWIYLARAEAWLGDYEASKRAYIRVLRRLPANIEATIYINKGGK
jgi:tetratricopeptide (TPR) repeat protein